MIHYNSRAVVLCPTHPDNTLPNGRIEYSQGVQTTLEESPFTPGYPAGSRATYICNENFILIGNRGEVCERTAFVNPLIDVSWTVGEQTCIGK